MGAQRVGMPTWLDVYPLKSETATWNPQKPVFVDVGGGFGHQCAGLLEQYTDLKGQVVLQDLPQTLAHAMPLPNVQVMEHDFFQPQPVKGMVQREIMEYMLANKLKAQNITIFAIFYTIGTTKNAWQY